MSALLVDIDANPRQLGFRPLKEGSKIPGPLKFRRSGSSDRRSPFSVSTTGSPRYTASSATSNTVVSPTPMSKLPRKSTPTQSTLSTSYTYGSRPVKPHSGLPRARGGSKPTAIAVPSNPDTSKTTLSLSCNKPLPSPPIAQIVKPASPSKAQRTLVDAEAGTPTNDQWPILRPENVSPSIISASSSNNGAVQRSVSEASALRRNDIPALRSPNITPFPLNNRTPSEKSEFSTRNDGSSHEEFVRSTELRSLSSMNPSTQSFHAFSTNTKVAIDSPLAHKQTTLQELIIPPRISSKRISLPLPGIAIDELPSQPPSAASRPAKPGSTKWLVLADATNRSYDQCPNDGGPNNIQRRLIAEPEPVEPASFGRADMTQSRYGSIDSISTWSLPAEWSLDDESETCYEGGVRIKRLSWHSSSSGFGPTLRISADADAVILGRDDSVPVVPALSEQMEQNAQERPTGTLTARFTKQKLLKMTSTAISRTSTPIPTETELIESKPVQVTPIRSMQPPRELITGDVHYMSALSSMRAPLEVARDEGALLSSQGEPCSSFETLRETSLSQLQSEAMPRALNEDRMDGYKSGKYSTILPRRVSQKPIQALTTDNETSQPGALKSLPLTGMTPVSANSKPVITRSNTSPFLLSSERLRAQVPRSSTRSPSTVSTRLLRATPSRAGVHQPGLSRLGPTELVVQDLDASLCKSTSTDTEAAQQYTIDNALKMKAKRSFRNVLHRYDPKATPQPAKKREPKRSSVTRSALAQRIRNSTNFSKISLSRPSEVSPEIKSEVMVLSDSVEVPGIWNDRQAALLAPEIAPTMLPSEPEPTAQYDTATVVYKILNRVTPMREESPDRLRGLEIAEAILHTVEYSKKANLSSELAKRHARDAELNAERADIEMKRLAKLCEPNLDDETMLLIKQLITEAGARKLSEIRAK